MLLVEYQTQDAGRTEVQALEQMLDTAFPDWRRDFTSSGESVQDKGGIHLETGNGN
jgi:hypothetical protein